MAFANLHVALAHAYLNAVQAFDVAALSKILAPATRVQFLPSASLGPMGKPMDKAGLLSVMESGRSTMKDGRLPMEIIEVTDASAAGLIIAHTKSKGAFTVTGKPVTNEYSIIMWMDEVEGELKVTRVREFWIALLFSPFAVSNCLRSRSS